MPIRLSVSRLLTRIFRMRRSMSLRVGMIPIAPGFGAIGLISSARISPNASQIETLSWRTHGRFGPPVWQLHRQATSVAWILWGAGSTEMSEVGWAVRRPTLHARRLDRLRRQPAALRTLAWSLQRNGTSKPAVPTPRPTTDKSFLAATAQRVGSRFQLKHRHHGATSTAQTSSACGG